MGNKFKQDIDIVREILLRPWYGPVFIGGLSTYKIYFGKNGGVYLLKNKKKIYLKNNRKK
jgi:hypothetical protein